MSKKPEAIPLCDLKQQYQFLQKEIEEVVLSVLSSGQYILGSNVRSLEHEIASYLGCSHAIGVGNGTDALHLVLRALDIGPGDEVITTPFTFVATAEAIGLVGATPVFVDINAQTYNIATEKIESAISRQTKAILPVHLYGQPCNMDAILAIAEKHDLHVVEDCAQAIGASWRNMKVGTLGTAGCFSFFPSKNLGCYGDGGMVATNDSRLAERIEMLRRHGGRVKYHHSELGMNSRLDEIQAAIIRVKLKYLDTWNTRRREIACRYDRSLSQIPGITVPRELSMLGMSCPSLGNQENPLLAAVYHQYTILVEQRDDLAKRLNEANIQTLSYYPVPLHLQDAYKDLGRCSGSLQEAEISSQRCLSLPMFPELRDEQVDRVCEMLAQTTIKNTSSILAT